MQGRNNRTLFWQDQAKTDVVQLNIGQEHLVRTLSSSGDTKVLSAIIDNHTARSDHSSVNQMSIISLTAQNGDPEVLGALIAALGATDIVEVPYDDEVIAMHSGEDSQELDIDSQAYCAIQ